MAFSEETISAVFEKTAGRCHICGKNIAFSNYGVIDGRGGWEIEHSIAKANGGTDHLNNLFPAHISCNRSKGTYMSRTARSWYGRKRAPLSKKKQERQRVRSAFGWGLTLATLGFIAGSGLALPAGIIGGVIGYSKDPEKR